MRITDLARQLRDYRLTTVEILYHMPDHPSLLQSFIWQDLDMAPHYPVLTRFLDYWQRNLDGKLHSVKLAGDPGADHPGRGAAGRRRTAPALNGPPRSV